MTTRHIFSLAIALFASSTASFAQVSPLDEVEKMTATFLSQPDIHALSYDAPSWRAAVESQLAAASDSTLRTWHPSSLVRLDAPTSDATAWCATWTRDGKSRLIWLATSTIDSRRETMAFVDDLDCPDTLYSFRPTEAEGLFGFNVAKQGADSSTIFTVNDIKCRMALRIMTSSIERKDVNKDNAEALLISRLDHAQRTITGNLDGLPELTVCDSPDNSLRTVTYMIAYRDFTSRCGGWIAMRNKRGDHIERLTDATSRIAQPDIAVLNAKSWYGALYTTIIQFRQDHKDYYALLGYKGSDATTKTRVIDVVSEGDNGNVAFGATKPFIHAKQRYRRRIFKYSINASMTIRYDERAEMIVIDHLMPNSRIMTGRPEFYGPDLSYDAYLLTDDGWKFQSDIQVTEEDGAQPNKEDGETLADNFMPTQQGRQPRASAGGTSPVNTRSSRKSSKKESWSGRSSQNYQRNKSSQSSNSWFDKGKGNSAPNIRRR